MIFEATDNEQCESYFAEDGKYRWIIIKNPGTEVFSVSYKSIGRDKAERPKIFYTPDSAIPSDLMILQRKMPFAFENFNKAKDACERMSERLKHDLH